MSFVRPVMLVLFILLSLSDVRGEEGANVSTSAVNEFITVSELNSIDRVYSAMLKNKIRQKIRDNCNGSAECIAKWTELGKQLLKEESTQVAKSREQMVQLLMARYSKEQLAWLIKTYNTPLHKDFRKFVDSNESAGPLAGMTDFLNRKIKQADAVVAKPGIKK